jgi:hypothetical protein
VPVPNDSSAHLFDGTQMEYVPVKTTKANACEMMPSGHGHSIPVLPLLPSIFSKVVK